MKNQSNYKKKGGSLANFICDNILVRWGSLLYDNTKIAEI